MSTWISEHGARRALTCVALLAALPGCLAPAPDKTRQPLTRAALGGGSLQITAPRGYCIDDGSLRRLAGGGGFALLAPCRQLSDTPGITAAPALMTVSVMPQSRDAATPDTEALVAAIAPAPVGAQGQRAGLSYAQVMGGGDVVLPGGDPRHWRGTRAVGGHLASLALYAPKDSALAGREGRLLLSDLAAGLSARGADAGAGTGTATDVAKTQRRGLFARLFPDSN